ncbi:MAG TPA: L-seryl-tRNA(Sec) selenium transferase, partial [Tepidisphaeraceae bacterium]|nr:L-seryl-tRNA(Sec) selenium transferase [Tepidisphaeraceae bacterium]
DAVLLELGDVALPRPAVTALVRRELALIRKSGEFSSPQTILNHIRAKVYELQKARIQPVINGTGILVHTNLGRSPLGRQVVDTLTAIASNYNNLEFDLSGGERGGRAAYLEHNLAVLCGAEAATVVNNGAAALVLILRHFTAGAKKQVIISRGELVQIGGGFRIPDILETSGAILREVGTTNKTSLADYSRALSKETALVLKVHRSNFFMGGFVESAAPEDLAALVHKKKVPFAEDLGSGATVNTDDVPGVEHEPTPAEVLRRGVDLVCFSGDKLQGGPQAGIIAGRRKLVASLKKDPLFRALRCDKLILSALQTTIDLQLSDPKQIPVIAMLHESTDALRRRAEAIVRELSDCQAKLQVGSGQSQIGGGTLPRSLIPSVTIDIVPAHQSVSDLAAKLRESTPPVIGYVSGGRLKLDLRTIFPHQDRQLVAALRLALQLHPTGG